MSKINIDDLIKEQENNEILVGNLIIKSTDHEIANIIDKYGVLVYSTRR